MNADGSPGVDAGVSAGARIGFLDEAGWVSLTTGFVLLVLAGGRSSSASARAPARRSGHGQATVTVA